MKVSFRQWTIVLIHMTKIPATPYANTTAQQHLVMNWSEEKIHKDLKYNTMIQNKYQSHRKTTISFGLHIYTNVNYLEDYFLIVPDLYDSKVTVLEYMAAYHSTRICISFVVSQA